MSERLPIHRVLPELRRSLREHTRCLLQADPGAGKSTVVPLELLEEPWLEGRKILLLEPRRLAARMVAERMAATLGERIGEQVGYRMRGESRCGPRTRLEVITEGILTRMLRADPALEGVGLLIFDEFHERSLQADLGLALALQSQEFFRPDLRLLVMSATLPGEGLERLLGARTPRIASPGRQHPVAMRHLPVGTPLPRPEELPALTARTVAEALREEEGSILAFLPGVREIRRTLERLRPLLPEDVEAVPLYGALDPALQRRVVAPAPPGRRKVVLATNLAETSLTIEGIRIVVDGGYERQVGYDPASGMDRTRTRPISRDSATQRAGRAGRTAPGVCYRLWSEGRPLAPHRSPEILRSDLAPLLLELAAWGADPSELGWIDPPPAAALESARELLTELELLDASGSVTSLGERALDLGEPPRIAHMLLRSAEAGLAREGALLALLLEERPRLEEGHDLRLALEELHRRLRSGDPSLSRLRSRMDRLLRRLDGSRTPREESPLQSHAAGRLVALAYPERVALSRGEGSLYLAAGGKGLRLPPDAHSLRGSSLLAVAEAGGEGKDLSIYSAAPLEPEELRECYPDRCVEREELRYNDESGRVEARRTLRYRRLLLQSRPLPRPSGAETARTLLEGVRLRGFGVLPHTRRSESLRQRAILLREELGDSWPDLSEAALMENPEEWLLPWIDGMSALEELKGLKMEEIWKERIGWEKLARLEALAPERLELPSGSKAPLDYSDPHNPVLAAKLQECFGWRETPRILEGRLPVTLHLLSPARRPLAVTRDLENFWRKVYPEVRKEMRGRYPKHPWPEDPWTAVATAKTKRGMGG